ncbi:DNA polymerase alpha subunit B [Leguminivora glycinivorella]|uniref:DNA polymerase alpha subunit B n=1 Tax=Leguminivora glycinivorella TaxID=1035111 RepID=UPI00200FDC32|nr:DNA polymerase alpha subunit B [Leguminivora glycinivorella]
MATEELLTEQFQFLGISVQKEVLAKCVSLCEEYDVEAETFVEQWMAFSLTNLNGAPPNLDSLDSLERKEFSKRADRLSAPVKDARTSTGKSVAVYGASVATQPDNEVLSKYIAVTPKRIKVEDTSHPHELTAATYSPKTGASSKYSTRDNAGTVLHSYGDDDLLQAITAPSGPSDTINVTQVPNHDGELYTKAMFGFELLPEKASIYDGHISYVSQHIMKKAGITESSSVRHKTQTEVTVAGRIECDADARLNPKCVVLQGTWEHSLSQAVPVDLDGVKQYSLFPGQVVVMRGTNPRGDKFLAQEVFCDGSLPLPDHRADIINALQGNLSMVVAAGPYTTSDNLSYEPLKDLVSYISTHKPHIVIMTGPFMDADHAKLKDNTLAETYKSLFEKLIDSLAELSSSCPSTKIYIVSSHKDAFHLNIFPSPPYSTRRKYTHIHFVPDPCTLNIGGVIVGATSADVLMQISQEEISLGMGGDKLSRMASHVISQQCYSPLFPAPPTQPTDAALWAQHAQMPATPHVLVLPSNFRYFVKEVNGTVVVNPERLSKGTGGGTLARLRLALDGDSRRVAAQVLRI